MTLVDKFVTHVIPESSFEEMDRIYLTNRVLARVGEGVLEVETNLDKVIDLKDQLVEEAVRLETIEDSQTAREILGAELMDLITPCPSQVNRDFWTTYAQSPEQAIADFYQLSQKNDYIKLKAIAKNIAYRVPSDYGELEITINLSKPEKDPKEIAAAKLVQASNYPQCQLCLENEGYHGRVNHPARSNHRIILLINIFTKGFIKSISILIGLVVGTAIAATMGLVDFSPVAAAPLVHVPTPLYFGMPTFEISSIVMMCIIATVSMVESTGVYLALSDITNDPIDSTRLRNGYRAEGLAVLLGGIFNTFPYTGFSQNVGLVKLSGIKTRLPIYYAAGFLVLLGLLPKFGALAQIIPSPVLGGAMLVMFGFVSLQGMQILARVDFANNEHNFLIAAVSIAAGVGLNNSNLFVSMPTAFQMFFSNGIVVASLLAIVLNAVLNHKKK